ncbi:MAG: bifunctional 5,10-methylenetetrahydrofolate dehydrogenase/5,10-methenyltetrahydrofolate cyclohydrolase [Bdellovibrionales bacterium]|nr:bifunctional 5,10-methylenetetrahydrofolate dehydrogenase/5,10-methenyltetrahydrofolate cyclohydrolase [Bdellovibrionales bacterium]
MIKLTAKPVIEKRRAQLAADTAAFKAKSGKTPHLSVVLVGEDPASRIYVANKSKAAELVGFTHKTILFPASATPTEVKAKIDALNRDPKVNGILVQRPLPKAYVESEVMFWVDPKKDVDCLHPENLGLVVAGQPRFVPCTPGGIMVMLEHYGYSVAKKVACVIGRSSIVGKPLAALLLNDNATIMQVHRSTQNPESVCRQADFVFVAAGAPRMLKKEWVKPGAVVIDVGIHRDETGKVFGDVDTDSVGEIPSALTPVPGGVGPMTIQVLLENTLRSAKLRS